MRLERVEILDMGPHRHASWSFEPSGLQVVYGPNEAGKSTFLAALRGGIFGQAHLAESRLVLPSTSTVVLTLQSEAGERIQLERKLAKKSSPKLTLADNSQVVGQQALVRLFPELNEVDGLMYETIFTFQLADLIAFSKAPKTMAAQWFGLDSPFVDPYALEGHLEREASLLYSASRRATKPALNQLLRAQQQLEAQVRAHTDTPSWYRLQERELESVTEQLESSRAMQKKAGERQRFLQTVVEMHGAVLELKGLERQLSALGRVPLGDAQEWLLARDWNETLARYEAEQVAWRDRLETLDADLQVTDVTDHWSRLMPEIGERRSEMAHIRLSVEQWRSAVSTLRDMMDSERQSRTSFPRSWTIDQFDLFSKTAAVGGTLFEYARQWEAKQEAYRRARDAEVTMRALEKHQQEIWAKRTNQRDESPSDAHQRLRARQANISEQLQWCQSEMSLLTRFMETQPTQGKQRRSPSTANSHMVGLAGLILLSTAWVVFRSATPWAYLCAGSGLFLVVWSVWSHVRGVWSGKSSKATFSLTTALFDDGTTVHHVDEARGLLQRLHRRQSELQQQMDELDEERDILHAWREAENQRQFATTQRMSMEEQEMISKKAYQSQLAAFQIDDTLWTSEGLLRYGAEAKNVFQMAEERARMTKVIDQMSAVWDSHVEQFSAWLMSATVQAMDAKVFDVSRVSTEMSWTPDEAFYEIERQEQVLDRLYAACHDVHKARVTRENLIEKRFEYIERLEQMEARRLKLAVQRDAVYRVLGVTDDLAYERVIEQEQIRRDLYRTYQRLLQDLILASGGEREAARVVAYANQTTRLEAERACKEASGEVEELERAVNLLEEKQWACRTRLQHAQVDVSGHHLRFELATVEAQVREVRKRYATLVLAKAMSRYARTRVETRQESPVLTRAGRYLETVTNGLYREIKIPFGSDGLADVYVVDSFHRRFALETLSRGTRELVYIVLRFALIWKFHAQGIVLPVVFDDPFVNLDDARAAAVLNLLEQEASDLPILFLTCHERHRFGSWKTTQLSAQH